jgi:hypothetical protein
MDFHHFVCEHSLLLFQLIQVSELLLLYFTHFITTFIMLLALLRQAAAPVVNVTQP